MAVASILTELSRSLSEILDKILLFVHFFLNNCCSHMYMLLKSNDMNKAKLRSEGYFSLIRDSL